MNLADNDHGQHTPPAKRRETADRAVTYLGKVPDDAALVYVVTLSHQDGPALTGIEFPHSGAMARAGYHFVLTHCMGLGYLPTSVFTVQLRTADGPVAVHDEHAWYRVVCKIYDAAPTDGKVNVAISFF